MQIEQMPMVRVFFEKRDRAKYTSHLDIMRMMTRALRRSGLPFWYTQGFNPHLYMTFALPIALGCESLRESMDLRLTEEMDLDEVTKRINEVLPPGFRAIETAPPQRPPKDIAWADYDIRLHYESAAEARGQQQKLEAFLAQPEILVMKKTKKVEKEVDLAPLVRLLGCETVEDRLHLGLRTAAGISLNIAPALFLGAFAAWSGCAPQRTGILREEILCDDLKKFR